MVPDVEHVGPELHLPSFSKPVCLEKLMSQLLIPGRSRWSAGVANGAWCNRGVGEQIRIEGKQ